jgi:dihydrofolate reductase
MVPFWPDMAKNNSGPSKTMNDFARTFAAVERIVVVSKSLKHAEGGKTTIIRSNLKQEILKLKAEKGKDILVGGVDLPSQLMQLGLIDEYRFVVQPIVAGEGRRLFDDVKQKDLLQLKLVESKTFQSGCVVLSYNSISNNA